MLGRLVRDLEEKCELDLIRTGSDPRGASPPQLILGAKGVEGDDTKRRARPKMESGAGGKVQ